MLTRQHRYSFRNGVPKQSANTPLFVMRYQKSDFFSYAIVVSKKVSSHAVDRNRIKRIYKRVLSDLVEKHGVLYSFVFYTRKQNNTATPVEIQHTIEQTLKKEGIIT